MKLNKKEIMNRALNSMTINIGKSGINDNVIEEIKRQLDSHEVLRIKFAKNVAREKETYINEIKEATRCQLVDMRGHVAVVYKKKP